MEYQNIYWTLYLTFYRITEVRKINGSFGYSVAFMSNLYSDTRSPPTDEEFKHFGDLSFIYERDLRPITDPQHILSCLISELRKKHRKISQEMNKSLEDVNAAVRARQLLLRIREV
jgi:hypothetical protein